MLPQPQPQRTASTPPISIPPARPATTSSNIANGGWIAHNPIQPAYPSWGRFNALQEHNQEILRKILEAAAASKSAPGSIDQKIGDFYASCMDEKRIEAEGDQALAARVRAHRQNLQPPAA